MWAPQATPPVAFLCPHVWNGAEGAEAVTVCGGTDDEVVRVVDRGLKGAGILARDPQASLVSVTWVLTEDGNDAVTRGEFEVITAELIEAADLFKTAFFKDQ
ncbi:hypothetical protein [Micromonospora globbae]|uniref:hypothetical protein n=1 Tax=Micromonospora globbae TaxID=1894969 RepID=UPI0034357056